MDSNTSGIKHRRYEMWLSHLGHMGQVISVPSPDVSNITDKWEQFDLMVGMTKACILEVRVMGSFCCLFLS